MQTALDRYGRLDILVNNAGILGRRTGIEDTTSEQWDAILDINAKGVFLGTKAAIPALREAGGGSIVNISSVAGLIGSKNGIPHTRQARAQSVCSPSPPPSSTPLTTSAATQSTPA